MNRSYIRGLVGIGICLLLGACGSPQATGGGSVPTSTATQAPPTTVPTMSPTTPPTTVPRTATRSTSLGTPAAAVPFYVIYDSGKCGLGRLDTSTNTYARQITTSGAPQVIPLTLSAQELATIRQKVEAIRFFDYPEQFSVTQTSGSPVVMPIPSIAYTVTVHVDGRTKTVTWTDTTSGPTNPQAQQLQELARLIEGIVTAHPEYQQMPKPEFGCL